MKKETVIARLEGLAKFNATVRGAVETIIVNRDRDSVGLMRGALMGDPTAKAIVEGCGRYMRDLLLETTAACLCCPAEFSADTLPTSFVVTLPFAQTDATLVSGACARCTAKGDAFLLEKAGDHLREMYSTSYPAATGGMA